MSAKFSTFVCPPGALTITPHVVSGVADEAVSVLSLTTPAEVRYADGTATDTLPAGTPAAVAGGGVVFDPTAFVWAVYTVVGSSVLSLIKEAEIETLTGDYTLLARITRLGIDPWQQGPVVGVDGTTITSTGGILSATGGGGGDAPTSQIQAGRGTVAMVSGDDTDTGAVVFPVAFPVDSDVVVVADSRSDDLTAGVVDGSETSLGFTAFMGRRTADTSAKTGLFNWHAMAKTVPSGPPVWVLDFGAQQIVFLATDGTVALPPVATTGYPVFGCVVGDEVWITLYLYDGSTGAIGRYSKAGVFLSAIFDGTTNPWGICVVGSEVWAIDTFTGIIARYNVDGSSAGSSYTTTDTLGPQMMAVVGSEVWVANSSFSTGITRYNPADGTSAGAAIIVAHAASICVVGADEVWIGDTDDSIITRLAFDGTSAGADYSAPYSGVSCQAVVGAQIWGNANYSAATVVFRQLSDSSSGGADITGFTTPLGIIVVS